MSERLKQKLVMRGLRIMASPGAIGLGVAGYDTVHIEKCWFSPVPPPPPRMDVGWLGRTGLLDPAHPQIGMPG